MALHRPISLRKRDRSKNRYDVPEAHSDRKSHRPHGILRRQKADKEQTEKELRTISWRLGNWFIGTYKGVVHRRAWLTPQENTINGFSGVSNREASLNILLHAL